MKKSLVILMGLLSLSVFAACGSNADADIDADDFEIDEDRDDDRGEDYDEDEEEAHSDPVSFVYSEDELNELLGTWMYEGVFTHWYTFTSDGRFMHEADGGLTEEGTYQFNGTDLLLESETFDEEIYFELSNGYLIDEDGNEYGRISESYEDDDSDDESTFDRDDIDQIVGHWEGVNTPPNDWFIFTTDADFYCYRDNGYIEYGTYEFTDSYIYLTYLPSGETDSFFLFDTDYLLYDPCGGLERTSTDDTVDEWILEAM